MGALSPAISQAHSSLAATASSVDESVFTPSHSPAASVHRRQAPGDEFDVGSSSSAAAYFESRLARRLVSGILEFHEIAITARMEPKDLPYPSAFTTRDCTIQDVR
jgi:hypothetical protein